MDAGQAGECARQQQGDRSLAGVEQQRGKRDVLTAGAQHVGRADIAGADIAYVAEARSLREHKPERNRAKEIAAHGGKYESKHQHPQVSNRRDAICGEGEFGC